MWFWWHFEAIDKLFCLFLFSIRSTLVTAAPEVCIRAGLQLDAKICKPMSKRDRHRQPIVMPLVTELKANSTIHIHWNKPWRNCAATIRGSLSHIQFSIFHFPSDLEQCCKIGNNVLVKLWESDCINKNYMFFSCLQWLPSLDKRAYRCSPAVDTKRLAQNKN